MPPRHGSGAAVVNPRPKWTPARRAFKEAPWRQQRLPSRASSSVATAKSRPISRQFGKPRGTRNPDTVDWKKARRWERRHGGGDEPLDEPTATVGAYQRAEVKPTSWRDWPSEPFPRMGRREYLRLARHEYRRGLPGSSSSDSEELSPEQSLSPSGDGICTPAKLMPTAAPTPKSASAQWLLNHASRAVGQSQMLRIERDWQDADAESQDAAAESASSRVAWGNRQQAELRQAVIAWQARQERRSREELRQAVIDTTSDVWSLLDRD